MNLIDASLLFFEMNRARTLGKLDEIEKLPEPQTVLGWRPGPGRAHIAWQLVHVGVTEELFATERFRGTVPGYADLVPRFRGGSTPDDDIPTPDRIRDVLDGSRRHLLDTLSTYTEADLETIPAAFSERGWTIGKALQILAWHEAHHQGQAHLTLNLWKASHM